MAYPLLRQAEMWYLYKRREQVEIKTKFRPAPTVITAICGSPHPENTIRYS